MKKSLLTKHVVPFIQWYGIFILVAVITDYFLHRYQLFSIGLYLGIAGTLLIIVSFVYSLRKRKIIKSGSPKWFLQLHEILAWTGATMILVHGGIHFNALLPWLAVLMMLIAVGSGLTGKFILKKASRSLAEKKKELLRTGISQEEVSEKLFMDSITVAIIKKWRAIHLPITLIFAILALMHILTIIMFSK